MIIRYARMEDIEDINDLLFQVHKIHSDKRPDLFTPEQKKYSDDELILIINNTKESPVFVAEIDNKVVAYAFCQAIRSEEKSRKINSLYIDDLCVDKNLRGKHIGSELLNYVLSFGEKNNFYNVTLNVWALNESAIKFYENNGMQIQKYGMEKIIKQELE